MPVSDEIKGYRERVRNWQKQSRDRRARIASKFLSLVESGKTVEEAIALTREVFECSRVVVENALDNEHKLPPGVFVDISVRQQRLLDKAEIDNAEIRDHAQDMLDEIEALGDMDCKWLETKDEFGFIGDKTSGKTERITLAEAKRRVLQWRAEALKPTVDIIKAFKPDVQINNSYYGQMTDEDLERLEKQERVKLRGNRDEKGSGGSAADSDSNLSVGN